jgi:hypothetical protein
MLSMMTHLDAPRVKSVVNNESYFLRSQRA